MKDKFQIGDMVQIMPTANEQKYTSFYGLGWGIDSMDEHIGDIGNIRELCDKYGGCCRMKSNPYTWLLEDIRLLSMQEVLNLRYK